MLDSCSLSWLSPFFRIFVLVNFVKFLFIFSKNFNTFYGGYSFFLSGNLFFHFILFLISVIAWFNIRMCWFHINILIRILTLFQITWFCRNSTKLFRFSFVIFIEIYDNFIKFNTVDIFRLEIMVLLIIIRQNYQFVFNFETSLWSINLTKYVIFISIFSCFNDFEKDVEFYLFKTFFKKFFSNLIHFFQSFS